MARTEKAPERILRSLVWSGGSVSMIVRRAAMSSSVGSSKETPRAEEYVAVSRLAATMSAYRLTDQNPEFGADSPCQDTGSSRRRRANSAYGTARAHRSRSQRSTGPVMAVSLAPNELRWQWYGAARVASGQRRVVHESRGYPAPRGGLGGVPRGGVRGPRGHAQCAPVPQA